VDTSLFRPLDRAACKRELGIPGFLVGYVGRLVEEKGLMDLIDALPHCPPDVNCIFLGSGPCQSQLANRARELNLASRVHFLPARPLEQLPAVMNALDLFVLPSRTTSSWKEQFGRVIIEAHACQTPVLGSNSGAIPDVIASGGLVFPERDPRALAGCITTLHADPNKLLDLGRHGRKQVEDDYTWQRIAVKMRAVYDRVAELL
jgi:glycosyltransferase involved in cell wall biosynthesis